MARIRTIKPEFFRHEQLYEAEKACGLPLRVAFAGIWTAADREGRFAWKPRGLKLDALPYDDVDFSAVLDALHAAGFLVKYQVGNETFGQIPSWSKHQHINVRESASTIPAPDVAGASTCAHDTAPVVSRGEGKGREGEGKGRSNPVVSTTGDDFPNEMDLKLAFDHWNETVPNFGLAVVRDRAGERSQKLKARLRDIGSLAGWCLLVDSIQNRPFCLGEGPRNGAAPWKVDIDYVLSKPGFRKLREGAWMRDGMKMGEVEEHASH